MRADPVFRARGVRNYGSLVAMQVPTPAVDPAVHRFAAWLTGSAAAGASLVEAAAPSGDLTSQLGAVFSALSPRDATKINLDRVLRNDPTAVMDMQHPLIRGEPRRLYVLQRQLQRTCLLATLGTLVRDRRATFILIELMGLTKAGAAAVMKKTESAVAVLLMRARSDLENYLAPRCEHLDPANFCHCDRRLAVALDSGFLEWPARDDLPGEPLKVQRHLDAAALYAALPPPG